MKKVKKSTGKVLFRDVLAKVKNKWECYQLLETVSLDNAIREFPLA